MIDKLRNNKAFTLIELIVVIAILGILVLLATPKFLGYTEDARIAQIKNDIRVIGDFIEGDRINKNDYFNGWQTVNIESLNAYKGEGTLFDKRGKVNNSKEFAGEYYKVPEKFKNSKLKGDFIYSKKGEVYYNDEVDGKYLATDDDFEWVENIWDGYENADGEKGYFKYVGTDKEIVEIPHVIQGTKMTSYYMMFSQEWDDETVPDYKKITSSNANITDMSQMFDRNKATSLDLSSFDTSNVTDMVGMFSSSRATSLDLSNWDTSSVTNMSQMFIGSQASSLDLSSFDTSSVTDMSWMFRGSQATTITFGDNFDTSNVTNMTSMFSNSQLTEFDLSSFDTSSVTRMSQMFESIQATSLDLSSFDTSKVTGMHQMFAYSQVTELDLSSFNTSNVTDMRGMFRESQATELDLSSFDTSRITSISGVSWMFYESQATTGYARTQKDANRFNGSSDIPKDLKFVVHPDLR